MEEFKNLKRVAINELKKLDTQYAGKEEFTEPDAKKFDCLSHGLKCLLTACAMLKEDERQESEEVDGMSEKRGRNMRNGQFVSREENNRVSYMNGFDDGVHAATENANMSGHHPDMYPYGPYATRRW